MRSVEFREKTSGDSHRNTMESLSQDKNGRRALLNKQIHVASLLYSQVVHIDFGFIHIMVCPDDIPTTNLWHIGLLFLRQ